MGDPQGNGLVSGLARYRLTGNPYERGPLDPVTCPEGETVISRIDGFKDLARVDREIDRAVSERRSCFLLVKGHSGGGRTSFANQVLARYRTRRGFSRERFASVSETGLDHDQFGFLKGMVVDIYGAINRARWPMSPDLLKELKEWPGGVPDDVLKKRCKILMEDLSAALAALVPHAGLGLVIEDVPDCVIVSTALEVFERSETIVVFTVEDYRRAWTDVLLRYEALVGTQRARDTVIGLSDIAGADVSELVLHWWARASQERGHPLQEDRHPFVDNAIEHAIGQPPRTVGRVMRIMAELLARVAREVGEGAPWTGDPTLLFTPDVLKKKVLEIDTDY